MPSGLVYALQKTKIRVTLNVLKPEQRKSRAQNPTQMHPHTSEHLGTFSASSDESGAALFRQERSFRAQMCCTGTC